MKKKCKRFI